MLASSRSALNADTLPLHNPAFWVFFNFLRFQSGDVFRKSNQSGGNSASHRVTSETLHVCLTRTPVPSVGTAAVGGANVSIDEKYSGNLHVPVVKSAMT